MARTKDHDIEPVRIRGWSEAKIFFLKCCTENFREGEDIFKKIQVVEHMQILGRVAGGRKKDNLG